MRPMVAFWRYVIAQVQEKQVIYRKKAAWKEKMPLTVKGENRVQKLLDTLTLDEKIHLLAGDGYFGIPGVERVGLKKVRTCDASIGLRGCTMPTTSFPAEVAMAASFDPELVESIGLALAEECRALGIGVLLGPGVNLARVPTCGRNFEYFGEDPYLSGEMAASYIGGTRKGGVVATVKHFVCNNSEHARHLSNSVVDERTLRELYLQPFHRAIEGGALAVMTSYNLVNGVHMGEHPYLVKEILRGEWGFDGLVVSDWISLYSTVRTIKQGVDLEMPKPRYYAPWNIYHALEKHLISEDDINVHVRHLLSTYEKAGLFDRPLVDADAKDGNNVEHGEIALRSAREAVCLLKNNGDLLPLSNRKIVIGGTCSDVVESGGGSANIAHHVKWETFAGRMARSSSETVVLPKFWWARKKWRRMVSNAPAIVLVVGFGHKIEGESFDRPWALPRRDRKAILEASKLNKHVIVVIQSGGAVETYSWIGKVDAVIDAFYLGQETAHAIDDVLFGHWNPSGRLPFTIAKDYLDYRSLRGYPRYWLGLAWKNLGAYQGKSQEGKTFRLEYNEGLLMGYRQFDAEKKEVAFCFGQGLSYTTFSYKDLKIERNGEDVSAEFLLSNTGDRDGAEVAQLYVHEDGAKVWRPVQELKAFKRVFLKKGETSLVRFVLKKDAFSYYQTEKWAFAMDGGTYTLCIGSSSRDIRLEGTVE
jgi:beta-glucosidase